MESRIKTLKVLLQDFTPYKIATREDRLATLCVMNQLKYYLTDENDVIKINTNIQILKKRYLTIDDRKMLNQYIEDLDRFSITQKVNTNNNAKIFLYDNDAYNTLFKTKSFEYEKFKQEREMREHNARALTFQEIKINKTKQIQLDNEIESKKEKLRQNNWIKSLKLKKKERKLKQEEWH